MHHAIAGSDRYFASRKSADDKAGSFFLTLWKQSAQHARSLLAAAACLLTLGALPMTAAYAQAGAAPVPETRAQVGPMQFRVVSFRLGQPENRFAEADITLEATNTSSAPIVLGYTSMSARMVDEKGYSYEINRIVPEDKQVGGVGIVGPRGADTSYVAEPQQTMRIKVRLRGEFKKGQMPGQSFDFSAEFVELEVVGEGKVKVIRRFPLTLIGMQKSSMRDELMSAPKDIGNGVKEAFGGIFR